MAHILGISFNGIEHFTEGFENLEGSHPYVLLQYCKKLLFTKKKKIQKTLILEILKLLVRKANYASI